MFKQLNEHEYLELLEVGETDEWEFRIVIAEAGIIENPEPLTEKEEPNKEIRELLNASKPIEVTESSKRYEIIFDDYVSYSVTNESYAIAGKNDKFEGKSARIYTQSAFLDYVANSTYATNDFPGPFKHYGFLCLDHIVDVASVDEPRIKLLNA